MRAGLTIYVVIAGCGYSALPALSGGPGDAGDDAAVDDGGGVGSSAGDAAPATGCLGHWLDGTVSIPLSSIEELTSVASAGTERDPWISRDGRRLYFNRNPGSRGGSDIYLATRDAVGQPFSGATNQVNLNTSEEDTRVALTPDERVLVMSHGGNSVQARIVMSTRSDVTQPFGTPNEAHLASVNLDSSNHYDPFLSEDGLRLYLSPSSGASGRQEIRVAVRTAIDGDFAAPVLVPGINSSMTINADPALSPDERVMVFASDRGGPSVGGNLYYATRPSRAVGFDPPLPIPGVNDLSDEFDPMLSADGCELYFSSDRAPGGLLHLFHAQITK